MPGWWKWHPHGAEAVGPLRRHRKVKSGQYLICLFQYTVATDLSKFLEKRKLIIFRTAHRGPNTFFFSPKKVPTLFFSKAHRIQTAWDNSEMWKAYRVPCSMERKAVPSMRSKTYISILSLGTGPAIINVHHLSVISFMTFWRPSTRVLKTLNRLSSKRTSHPPEGTYQTLLSTSPPSASGTA